jgi:hypothetical protein
MAIWMQKANRIRLASMGLTQQIWSADWAEWLTALQRKRGEFQSEALAVGEHIVSESSLLKPFGMQSVYQVVGTVDLIWISGRDLFDDMLATGLSLQKGNTTKKAKAKRRSTATKAGGKKSATARKPSKSRATASQAGRGKKVKCSGQAKRKSDQKAVSRDARVRPAANRNGGKSKSPSRSSTTRSTTRKAKS